MKIALAQIEPKVGDLNYNIDLHNEWIDMAISYDCRLIAFPELSLSAYEPKIANDLQLDLQDEIFNHFQKLADENDIVVCVGFPERSYSKPLISMGIFQKGIKRKSYSKQFIHEDEKPYFSKGKTQEFISVEDKLIAPAICYESSQEEHHKLVFARNIDLYLASVAKHQDGINKSEKLMSTVSKKYNIPVAMVNCLGESDGNINAGNSFLINSNGELNYKLEKDEGLLFVDI